MCKGISKTIKNYRGIVNIPDKFYRIAFDYKNTRAVAWVVPNDASVKNHSKGMREEEYLSSIDTIEAMTGLNFFSLMSKDIQDKLESEVGTIKWLKK